MLYKAVIYILDHQQTYTREVITQQLLDAGYDRETIDNAFRVVNLNLPTRESLWNLGFSLTEIDIILPRLLPKTTLVNNLLVIIGIILVIAGCLAWPYILFTLIHGANNLGWILLGYFVLTAIGIAGYSKMTSFIQKSFIVFIVLPFVATALMGICIAASQTY